MYEHEGQVQEAMLWRGSISQLYALGMQKNVLERKGMQPIAPDRKLFNGHTIYTLSCMSLTLPEQQEVCMNILFVHSPLFSGIASPSNILDIYLFEF